MLEEGMLQFALLGAGWVLWVLVGLSVGVVALSLERVIHLTRDKTPRADLAAAFEDFLRTGDTTTFRERLSVLEGYEARVLSSGAELAPQGPLAMQRAMEGTAVVEKLRMERGLSYLATVGSNAPFIGLFGTVLGIIRAFRDLSLNSENASEAVMTGISEALVATAVGLLVAIPAVVLYNAFSRWVKGRIARTASLADLVLARVTVDRGGAEAPSADLSGPEGGSRAQESRAHGS